MFFRILILYIFSVFFPISVLIFIELVLLLYLKNSNKKNNLNIITINHENKVSLIKFLRDIKQKYFILKKRTYIYNENHSYA